MAEDMVVFQKPEDLCKWLAIKNSDVRLEKHEASIIFNYMEGHDYQLGFAGDKLLRQDIAGKKGEMFSYSIDEVIDMVCEWNYELIQEATALRSEASLSQGQVAAKLGMSSHSHIAAIETGRVVPRLNTFLRILSLYDHTIKIVRKDSEK